MQAPGSVAGGKLPCRHFSVRNMATEQAPYTPDSDDEMDTSGDEMDEIPVTLTPQEWKAKAGDRYKVGAVPRPQLGLFCVPGSISNRP